MNDQALFPRPSRPVGEVERALLDQLELWDGTGHRMPGAVRAGLRRMAYNCDTARPGQGLAHATDRYLEQLRQWSPDQQATDDTWADFLTHARAPQVPDEA